jgi:tetratricopeptide (TPR) repeat protein
MDTALRRHPLAQDPPGSRVFLYAATLYAMGGRPDKAREIMREREATLTDTLARRVGSPGEQAALAEIELAEGRPLEAIKLWRMADTLPDGPVGCAICLYGQLGRAFSKTEYTDSTIYWYEKYVNTPYMTRFTANNDPLNLAAAYKTLGEAYEAKGDRAKAREYYEKFVKLWEKADPDLRPVVQSVRARLARLSGEPPPQRGG